MIPVASPSLDGNELAYVADCIRSGWVSSKGSYVSRFEDAWAARCGVRHGIAVSSGTAALHVALLTLGVGPGDDVLVPALTYVATANAVAYTGARPVFVDVDRTTWNLDLAIVEQKLNPQVKGIVPVHLYGYPTDMCALQAVASKYELWLVEDACEAHGAECRGVAVGGMGHVGCFSFYGNKTVTTGEGGMLVTDSDELAGKARALRNQASSDGGYWHPRVGFSYRLTSVQAAIGLAQVERLEEFIEARRRIARMYGQLLSSVRGISLHAEDPWSRSVCWLYTILIEDEFGMTRDELMVYLSGQGIECRPVFVPLPSLPAYADGETYPVAERLARCGLSLPTYVGLKPEQTEYIVERIRRAQREATARRQG